MAKGREPWEIVQDLALIHVWPNFRKHGEWECGAPYLRNGEGEEPSWGWEDVTCIRCLRSVLVAKSRSNRNIQVLGDGALRRQIRDLIAKLEAKVNDGKS
jgi:hypothetical protein